MGVGKRDNGDPLDFLNNCSKKGGFYRISSGEKQISPLLAPHNKNF